MGVAGSTDCVQPLVDFRRAHCKGNGREPAFSAPRISHLWELERAVASPYTTHRRKLALLRAALGDHEGEKYTPHSPKTPMPAAENQRYFYEREQNVIGNWPINSEMHERYGRSVCANELMLGDTIIQRIVGGWSMAPDCHMPETVPANQSTGKVDVAPPPEGSGDATPLKDELPPTQHLNPPPDYTSPASKIGSVVDLEYPATDIDPETIRKI